MTNDIAHYAAPADETSRGDYLRRVTEAISTEYNRTILLDPKELRSQITIVGTGNRKVTVSEASARDFVTLVEALKIPVRLNGMDLIIGVVAGNKISPYITAMGEWAICLRDSRMLRSIDTRTEMTAVDDGTMATVATTVTFEDGSSYTGTDVVFLPSYNVFRRYCQDHAWANVALDDLRGDPENHSMVNHAVTFLTEIERKLNRARAFSLRFAETSSRRRAMTAARGAIPIVPMADEEALGRVVFGSREELITALVSRGLMPMDILELAAQVTGKVVGDMAEIPEDENVLSDIWRAHFGGK